MPLDAVREGDILAVAPGARIPVDGTVTAGRSEIDPSLLTGETMPEPVAPGAAVRAGMLNLSGPLELRADALGEDTLLREIARLVETAERSRGRYASLADRASRAYSPIVYLLALAALLGWGLATHDWRLATNVAAAVLIVTCPCGLGLAVPAVLTAASGRLFRLGVLLKDGEALEKLADRRRRRPRQDRHADHRPARAHQRRRPRPRGLRRRRRAGRRQRPPALPRHRPRRRRGRRPPGPASPTSSSTPASAPRDASTASASASAAPNGSAAPARSTTTAAWLRLGDAPAVALAFADAPRPEAAATVARLQAAGLQVMLLSGDAEAPGRGARRRLGIDRWIARATPAGKVAELDALRAEGRRVLMVGDGLNDAAALAAAHVSISPASAIDASRSAADLIVLGDRIDRAADALGLARIARRRILENFALAFGLQPRRRADRARRPRRPALRRRRHVGELDRRRPQLHPPPARRAPARQGPPPPNARNPLDAPATPLNARQCAVVAQSVRVPACHAGGRGFEPRQPRHFPATLRHRGPACGGRSATASKTGCAQWCLPPRPDLRSGKRQVRSHPGNVLRSRPWGKRFGQSTRVF